MKVLPASVLALFAIAVPMLSGQQIDISMQAFGIPGSFNLIEGDNLGLRVVELVPAADTDTSTHIIIEGLSPLEEGTQVYASTYVGIDTSDGSEQSSGVLYATLPEGVNLPEGTVSSPIVGVAQRPGSWADYDFSVPQTALGGAAGTGDIASGGDFIDVQLTRDNETFTGSIPYTQVDENTLELAAFTLVSDGTTSVDLSGGTLTGDGNRFYGVLTNLGAEAPYDALLYGIVLSGFGDAGGLQVGLWNRLAFSWVFGLSAEWGVSDYMGYVNVAYFPYVYQLDFGWLYYFSSIGTQHFFYHFDQGWILTDETWEGYYWLYANGTYQEFPQP